MSRISSSSTSGVRVAAQPLSNIYTVLLLIGALGLVGALVMLWVTLDGRYGATFAIGDKGKAALKEPAEAKERVDRATADLAATTDAMKKFPEVMTGPGATPAEGTGTTPPATPAPAAPAEAPAAAPAAPAAAPAAPAEAPAAPAAPAADK